MQSHVKASTIASSGRGDPLFLITPQKKRGGVLVYAARWGVVPLRGGFSPPKVQRFF